MKESRAFPEAIKLPDTKPGPDDWVPTGEAVKWIAAEKPPHVNGLPDAENAVRTNLRAAIKAGKLAERDGKVRITDVALWARGIKSWRGAANVLPAIQSASAPATMTTKDARMISRQAERIVHLEAEIARLEAELKSRG